MKNEKLKFIKNSINFVLVFILLSLLFCGLPLYIFLVSGEGYTMSSINNIIIRQSKTDDLVLFGSAYGDPTKYYKLRSVSYKKYDVISLGGSRVLQFRSGFFYNSSFYNAGGGVAKIGHFKPFFEKIPYDKQPKILIMGLDQHYFNYNWDNGEIDDIKLRLSKFNNPLLRFKDNILKIYTDYLFKRKFDINSLRMKINENRIGLNAIIFNNGFRNDGSVLYGKVISEGGVNNPNYPDFHFKYTLKMVHRGSNLFTYGTNVSSRSLNELDSFLNLSKKRGIYVIGFLPPYAHLVWEEVKSGNKQSYMFKLNSTLRPIFEKYGFDFYDFSDLQSIGASDCETMDGFHGSEKAYLRLFIKMAKNNEVLKDFTDITYLENQLNNSDNCFTVFDLGIEYKKINQTKFYQILQPYTLRYINITI